MYLVNKFVFISLIILQEIFLCARSYKKCNITKRQLAVLNP